MKATTRPNPIRFARKIANRTLLATAVGALALGMGSLIVSPGIANAAKGGPHASTVGCTARGANGFCYFEIPYGAADTGTITWIAKDKGDYVWQVVGTYPYAVLASGYSSGTGTITSGLTLGEDIYLYTYGKGESLKATWSP